MPLAHTVEEIQLKNGAKGLLVNIPGSSVLAYSIHFRAGYYYAANKDRQQTPHVMEHMAFKGTKEYPTPELLSKVLSKNGAYRNAYTSEYDMEYVVDAPLTDWKRLLSLQKDVIAKPFYKEDTFKAEKLNVVEELTGQAGNHRRLLSMTMNKAMGESSLLDNEKIQTVDAITLDDVREHHARTHVSQNVRFCFSGDLASQKEDIIALLESWELPEGERLSVPTKQYHAGEPVAIFRKDLPSVSFIFRIALNRTLSDAEKASAIILNHILTGTFHSRIFGEAREKGLCYGLGSDVSYGPDGVTRWEIGGQVMPKNAQPLFELITRHLKEVLNDTISIEEIEDAKQFLVGRHQMQGQDTRDINDWYAGRYFDYGDFVNIEDRLKVIQSINAEQIQAIFKELCAGSVWTLGTIGNMKAEETAKLAQTVAPLFKEGDNK